jgi:hypothetical protein
VNKTFETGVLSSQSRLRNLLPFATRYTAGHDGNSVDRSVAGYFRPLLSALLRSAEERLCFYAERFNTVEVDSTYYALPAERNAKLWAERTPEGFLLNIKPFALMTQHSAEISRLPRALSEILPPAQRRKSAANYWLARTQNWNVTQVRDAVREQEAKLIEQRHGASGRTERLYT